MWQLLAASSQNWRNLPVCSQKKKKNYSSTQQAYELNEHWTEEYKHTSK